MSSEYKVSPEIKWMFILNILLFTSSFMFNEKVAIAVSFIIFVILVVANIILKAIHKLNKGE